MYSTDCVLSQSSHQAKKIVSQGFSKTIMMIACTHCPGALSVFNLIGGWGRLGEGKIGFVVRSNDKNGVNVQISFEMSILCQMYKPNII